MVTTTATDPAVCDPVLARAAGEGTVSFRVVEEALRDVVNAAPELAASAAVALGRFDGREVISRYELVDVLLDLRLELMG